MAYAQKDSDARWCVVGVAGVSALSVCACAPSSWRVCEDTVSAAAAVMAAGILTARLFLLCVLSEVSHSSPLPRVGRSLHPRAWQDGRGDQDVHANFQPFQYMMALRQTNRNLHPNVHDQVQVRAPRPYQPRSSVATQRPVETSVLQPRTHRNEPLAKPRSFDLSLKIPFAHGHHDPSRYRPSGFHIHNSFNNPLRNHDASKPGYQFSISVPVSHASPPHHPGSHHSRPHRPKYTGWDHQAQQHLHVPFDTRPSSPSWHSRRHFEQTGREDPREQEFAFLQPGVPNHPSRPRHPPKYDRYSGYHSSQQNPAQHDYWRHYRGHYHGPHRGPYQSRAEHSSSEPWPDFNRSD